MLLFCFQLTKDYPEINEFLRQIILRVEVPVIKFLLRFSGAAQVIPRHSVHQRYIFNSFMSDLDFTVVAQEKHFSFLDHVYWGLRKVFPNLGEVEFYQPHEWEELLGLQYSPHYVLWEKIYLLRKLSWQQSKLHKAKTSYEKVKQARAIELTLNRLNQFKFPLSGDEIFPELHPYSVSHSYYFPRSSGFLEHEITIESGHDLVFKSLPLANTFIYILPESHEVFPDSELNEFKYLLVRKEYYLTKTSMRLKKIRQTDGDISKDESWIKDLEDLTFSLGEKLS